MLKLTLLFPQCIVTGFQNKFPLFIRFQALLTNSYWIYKAAIQLTINILQF